MKTKRLLSILLLLSMLISLLPMSAVASWASELDNSGNERTDAMDAIESGFPTYKIGETQTISDDGYIGIPVELSIYFDKVNHKVVPGHNGTPIIVYVVNTNTERVGTDSDETIIQSMLDRGYVVVVLDYLNNEKATSLDLDWSVHGVRADIKNGIYFTDDIFPDGMYYDNHMVPAGYDVSLNNVFWEADKHGADGTLEKIVENWNNDFKAKKAEMLVKWVYQDGTKKTVAAASDGSDPVWYNASGTAAADGEYTKVKYTVAKTLTDCVNPDGSPLDLSLYINIIHPTNPKEAVPVMSEANCAGYMAGVTYGFNEPHMNGFLFNGYAGVVFDHLYVPMAQDDSYGYYDGTGASGDGVSYTLHIYNNKLIITAAMRFLRYLAADQGETYKFDTDSFGYFGNSKGGGMTFLGAEVVQSPLISEPEKYSDISALEKAISSVLTSFKAERCFEGHHGETRYENGITEAYTADGATVDGGEIQPWLTYEGKELLSGAQWIYSSNGAHPHEYTDGSAPAYVITHFYDEYNNQYTSANKSLNICRTMNVPTVFFEVPLGHALTIGKDVNYGVDTYLAMFDFANYYLKNAPVKVLYTEPQNGGADIKVNSPIAIAFSGEVTASEISKVTVKDENGSSLSGSWRSEFGGTKWYFTPDEMNGSEKYTLTVPAALSGDNGVPMGADYIASFYTEYDVSVSGGTLKGANGDYFYLTAPAISEGENKFVIRFRINGDAANVAKLYAVEEFDTVSPDNSVVGELLGKVNLSGSGYYEIDVTDYVAGNAGKTVAFLLQSEKAAGTSIVYASDFSSSLSKCVVGSYAEISLGTAPDRTAALKAIEKNNKGKFPNNTFYSSPSTVFTVNDILGFKISEADYGRSFKITLRVYDTASRRIILSLNSNTNKPAQILDYDCNMYTVNTVAGEWTEFDMYYSVYDIDYGAIGLKSKSLLFDVETSGSSEKPIYISDITVTETVTEIDADNFTLAAKANGTVAYKPSESEKPFAIYSGDSKEAEYTSWAQVMSAYKYGQTVKLQSDYVLTDADLWGDFSTLAAANGADGHIYDIDLNGYEISCANSKNALLWLKNTSSVISETVINIRNGGIVLKNTPLISYDSSTASGAGKSFKVNLDSVNIGVADKAMLTELISSSTIASGADTSVKVTLNDCGLDVPDRALTLNYKTLLPLGSDDLSLEYTLNGGYIKLTSRRWVDIRDSFYNTVFGKGTDGKYTQVIMPKAAIHDNSESFKLDEGVAILSADTEKNNVVTYQLEAIADATDYGIIPEIYSDVSKYPIIVFSNGDCLGGFSSWNKAVGQALRVESDAVILLRDDFNIVDGDNAAVNSFNGTLTIDLGEHTLGNTGSNILYCYSSSKEIEKVFTVNIKNGTMRRMHSLSFINIDAAAGNVETPKKGYFNFENVTFENANNSTGVGFILHCWENNGVKTEIHASFTDCVFDLTESASGVNLFNVGNVNREFADVDIKMYGGEILAGSLTSYSLFVGGNGDSFAMGQGSDGEYPLLKTQAGGAAVEDNIISVSGANMCFSESGTDGQYTVYKLKENDRLTPYGTIGSNYADAEAYPFVLFKNGAFISGYSAWNKAMEGVVSSGSGSVLLMRRDYEVLANGNSGIDGFAGSFTVDLGEHTLSNPGSYILNYWNPTNKNDFTITFKNGNMVKSGSFSLIAIDQSSSTDKKNINICFEDVVIKTTSSSKSAIIVSCWDNRAFPGKIKMVMTDCVFDYTNAPSGINMLDITTKNNGNTPVEVHINGGRIIADDLSKYSIYKKDTGDTVTFGKGTDGAYTSLETLAATSQITTVYPGDKSEMYFVKSGVSADGNTVTYSLANLSTPYGDISIESPYTSVLDYPLVLFKDQTLKGGYSNWKDAMKAAAALGNGATLYVRRDYEIVSGQNFDFNSLNSKFIVDLGGNTVTSKTYVMNSYSSTSNNGCVGEVTFKNGKWVRGSMHSFACIEEGNPTASGYMNITIRFENISIADAHTDAGFALIFTVWDGKGRPFRGSIKLILDDCEIDLNGVSTGAAIIGAGATANDHNVSVTINGGNIIASDIGNYKLFVGGAGDELLFGKYEGKYTTLTTIGSLPTNKFDTVEGYKAVFGKLGEVYTLVPAEMKIIGAFLNIQENINVGYTVVLPVGYENPYMVFEFNGKTYKVTKYTTNADGSLVFKFVGVTPQMLGDNIKATLYATNGNEVASYEKAEYSVRTYCVNMLAKTDDAKLKTLLSDLLVYGAKSQIFANYKTDALVTNGVEGLTPSTFTEVTKTDMALAGDKHNSVSWKSAALRYENAMAMKFNFKADANLVLKITINGRTTSYNVSELKANEDTGLYTVYFRGILATEYGDVVTASFYNGDTQVGQSVTYSVNSYVKSKQNDSNTALAELVKATYNYGASAEAYVGQ